MIENLQNESYNTIHTHVEAYNFKDSKKNIVEKENCNLKDKKLLCINEMWNVYENVVCNDPCN